MGCVCAGADSVLLIIMPLLHFPVVFSIAVAVLLWKKIYTTVPTWTSSVLTSSVFLGCIVGMLALGYLGDVLGRTGAMSITMVRTGLNVGRVDVGAA